MLRRVCLIYTLGTIYWVHITTSFFIAECVLLASVSVQLINRFHKFVPKMLFLDKEFMFCSSSRYNAKRRHWRRTKLKL